NEINLATLNERNRISKELHDHIGHLLSRALLQVGALLTLTNDDTLKLGLTELKESLSGGMDQIRSSIHNMYDDSIDLYQELNKLVRDFSFCSLEYSYCLVNQPSLQLKLSFIFIIKEALANIIRHSNASKASLILREHPAMYQLIIQDNGTISDDKYASLKRQVESASFSEGMGLHNIAERVSSFGGILNISLDNGFRIFISVPKKEG
ncbi:MAG: two-component sensor histidine kinase, partial [Clostridiales bacterium]|nr:two-component sensor histidine kinase [Clostridiales bacterium]